MRLAPLFLVVMTAGCAPTKYPLLYPQSLMRETDWMALEGIDALARGDRAKLATMGLSEEGIRDAATRCPRLLIPVKLKFVFDSGVGTSYLRQYIVSVESGGETHVNVGFIQTDDGVKVTDFEFPDQPG